MKAELLDVEKFCKVNNLAEVTDPISFDRGGVPTKGGLFSSDIFGVSVSERRYTWAYIDLGGWYLAPKAFIALTASDQKFEHCIYGNKTFIINGDGELQEDPTGETGLEFLYKNWEKFKFKESQSTIRTERIGVLTNTKKDVLFLRKWIVLPAFFRDVNQVQGSSSNKSVPVINDKYNEIIRCVQMIKSANTFDFMINGLKGKIQTLMVEIYTLLKMKLEKKNGYFRKFLMGKSNDYCARVVMTATPWESNKPSEQKINSRVTGIPLYMACALTTPYILWWVGRFFKREFDAKDAYPIRLDPKDTKPVYVRLKDPEVEYNSDYISKQLDRMIENPSSRFDTIPLPIEEDDIEKYKIKTVPLLSFTGTNGNVSTTVTSDQRVVRPMTWTDVFYMAAVDVCEDKHCEITRYPLLDYLGTYFSDIYVMSTRETVPMIINDRLYPDYPKIDLSMKSSNLDSLFIDALKTHPAYLSGLDGDFDGDQVTVKIIFSQEGNEEAKHIMNSKMNIVTSDGGIIRDLGKNGIQTLYTMTRFR